jgi:two-component system response regulator AtoC
MGEPNTVLVVDDDPEGREQLMLVLETLGYQAEGAASGEEALARLSQEGGPDAMLLDVMMPHIDGLEILKRYRSNGGRAPVIMISGIDKVDTVVTAMRLGATDYITKPYDGDELRDLLDRVLNDSGRPRQLVSPRPGSTPLGQSAAMQRVAELVERIADADVPVLLTGESGVGKDVVARELHARSARSARVFVKINCAALPGELLESELFGHERGSFTGAARTKPGQFELADGGTLFLDEIGEMPVSLQAKLLQALQDGEFYRVGGQRKIRVDARVIVATNRDLERAMVNGTFREDLYYRLNVVHLQIPPLRDRREDIPQLIDHFVAKYGKRYGRTREDIPPHVVARFLTYDWPGNIRELENLVRRIMVLRDPRYVLSELKDRAVAPSPSPSPGTPMPSMGGMPPMGGMPQMGGMPPMGGMPQMGGMPHGALPHGALPHGGMPHGTVPHMWQGSATPMASALAAATAEAQAVMEESDFRIDLKDVGRKAAHAAEREAIVVMLGHTGGNKREAAERLGISYKAILYKIREFGIGRPRPPRRPPSLPPTTEAAVVTFTPPPGEVVEDDPELEADLGVPIEAEVGEDLGCADGDKMVPVTG